MPSIFVSIPHYQKTKKKPFVLALLNSTWYSPLTCLFLSSQCKVGQSSYGFVRNTLLLEEGVDSRVVITRT